MPSSPTFVLILDDDRDFANFQQVLLESCGLRAFAAVTGRDALQHQAQLAQPGAVALVDMMMPVIDGLAWIQALQALFPKLKFIASSGNSRERFAERLDQLGVDTFLGKPYTIDQLLEAISQALGEPAHAAAA